MGEIGSGNNSSYPGELDTNSIPEVNSPAVGKTKARKEPIEDLTDAMIKVETELGTDPAGSLINVKTFLQTQHQTDGTHKNTHGPHKWIDAADYSTFTDAINAAIGKTLFISSSITLEAGAINIPATVLGVYPLAPGVISKGSATSLTISGPVVGDPRHQWLSGFAAGEVTFGIGSVTEVHPVWVGINTTPGTTDYTLPLDIAYAAAATAKCTLILPAQTMRRTSTFLWNKNVNVIGVDKQFSIIKKYGNFIGIKIGDTVDAGGQEQRLENFSVDSFSGQGDASAGIEVWVGNGLKMNNVQSLNQGGHGIHLRGGAIGWYTYIKTNANGGDGFRVEGGTGYAATSANANTIIGLDTINNGGCGLNIINGNGWSGYTFGTGIVAQENGADGVRVSDRGNILSVYTESNTGYDVHLDSNALYNFITINALGSYTTKFRDYGSGNSIMDIGQGLYFKTPTVSAPWQSDNAIGNDLTVIGGRAGEGATGYVGGDLYLLGGDAKGTTGVARGGHVRIYGGDPINGTQRGYIYLGLNSNPITDMLHGSCTLTANQTTTVVSNTNIQTNSRIILHPTSANAAADFAAGMYVSAKTAGASFTITHPNNANADKTFDYIILTQA